MIRNNDNTVIKSRDYQYLEISIYSTVLNQEISIKEISSIFPVAINLHRNHKLITNPTNQIVILSTHMSRYYACSNVL